MYTFSTNLALNYSGTVDQYPPRGFSYNGSNPCIAGTDVYFKVGELMFNAGTICIVFH